MIVLTPLIKTWHSQYKSVQALSAGNKIVVRLVYAL